MIPFSLWDIFKYCCQRKLLKCLVLASVVALDNTSESLCTSVTIATVALNSRPLSLWAAVFLSSYRSSIVNEEDRRETGLLVLIYPGGSLGITINSQLRAHSTGPHRHCQFVPIREPSFWVSAVRSSSGPTGEQPARAWHGPEHSGLGCTQLQ